MRTELINGQPAAININPDSPSGFTWRIMKIGDTITYRAWTGETRTAQIEEIELCKRANEKYGQPVKEVNNRSAHRCCLILNDCHWIYGTQIIEIK